MSLEGGREGGREGGEGSSGGRREGGEEGREEGGSEGRGGEGRDDCYTYSDGTTIFRTLTSRIT